MQLIQTYTFTPGPAGGGTIKFAGAYSVEEIISIVNVTQNAVYYDLELGTTDITVQVNEGNTTILLGQSTSRCSTSDQIKIQVLGRDYPTSISVNNSVTTLSGLGIPPYDYIDMSYSGSNLSTVLYKVGGEYGTIVATVKLSYDEDDNIIKVERV